MKKIIISLAAILIFKIGFSQNGSPLYPITQNLGSSSSLVDVKGGQRINGAFVLGHFVDTAAANAIPYVKNFANGLITTDTSLVWLRSYDAKKWLLMPTQGRIVNGDSINYLVDVNRPPGQLNVYGKFFNGISAYSRLLYTDSIGSGGGSSYTFPYSVVAPGNAIQLENDTTANPANYFYGRNSAGRRGWYPQSGITGVNLFNSNGTLTGNRTVYGNGNQLEFNAGGGDFVVQNVEEGGISSQSGAVIIVQDGIVISHGNGGGSLSKISLTKDSISIQPNQGKLKIDTLNYTLSTTGKKILVRDTATGLVENIDPALIGGGGSGTVTSVATNNGTGITGGTITGSGTLAIDTANTIATRLQVQHLIDSLAALNYNLLVENLGATGTEMQRVNNDTLYIRKIVAGDFILVDTLATGEVQVTIDTASSAFQAYIASYGGGGSGDGNLARAGVYGDGVHNQWLDTTINRIAYSEGNFIYRVAITDSIDNTTYDADAQAYIDAVNATDVTLTVAEKGFINDYVIGLKADGLWSLIYDQGLPIWGTAASSAVMLKLTHTTTWVNTPTFSSTGTTGNGTTQYGNLNFSPATAYSGQDNAHVAVYIQNAVTDVNQTDIGVTNGSSAIRINSKAGAGTQTYLNDVTVGVSAVDSSTGFTIYTRTSSTNVAAYKDGTFVNNNTSTSTSLAAIKIFILASNQNGSPGVYSTRTMSLWSVGGTLNGTQAGNLSTRVNQLMTDLGINVY